jgi:hypothetical protein
VGVKERSRGNSEVFDGGVTWSGHFGRCGLIKKRADVHGDNNYALRLASENGYLEVVKYLVSQRANVHAGNDYAPKLVFQRRSHGSSRIFDWGGRRHTCMQMMVMN